VTSRLVLASTSRAQDAGLLALADVAAIAGDLAVEYRLVGGHMVSLLVAHFAVVGVPERETADADFGASLQVVADPRLPEELVKRGFAAVAGNRFERKVDELSIAIDILAPSYEGRHVPSQQHGALYVDEIPGLSYALVQPGVELTVEAVLTDRSVLMLSVVVPGPLPALCLKALAYGSRYEAKDAVDVWRLLEVVRASGATADGWPSGSEPRDAKAMLRRHFLDRAAAGVRDVSNDTATQTRVRALVQDVIGTD
jgi:hypothetical protein